MRPENKTESQTGRTFIEQARRAQIVQAAMQVLAEVGFAKASLARIAEHAGISKGVISYHFAGKEELMEQIVEGVYTEISENVVAQMMAEATPDAMLRRNFTAAAAHMLAHREQVAALGEIFVHFRDADGRPRYGYASSEPLYQAQESLYRAGQESGVFRDFDPRVMSVTHQAALDSMFGYWVANPDHDLEAHARELAELFDRATRADAPSPPSPAPDAGTDT